MTVAADNRGEKTRSVPLRRLLFVSFAGVVTLALAVAAVGLGTYNYARSKRQTEDNLSRLAQLSGMRLGDYLTRHRQAVELAAQIINERGERPLQDLEGVLSRAREVDHSLLTMLIADARGDIRVISPSQSAAGQRLIGTPPPNLSDRQYFTRAVETGRPFISDGFMGRGFGIVPIVAVSAPLRETNGEFAGIVEASLNLIRLMEFQAGNSITPSAEIVILDGRNQVVFASDKQRYPTLTIFDELPLLELARAEILHGHLSARNGRPALEVICAHASVKLDGMERPWRVLVTQDWASVQQQILMDLLPLGLGLLASVLLIGLVAHGIARRMLRSLESLAGAASQAIDTPPEQWLAPQNISRIRELRALHLNFIDLHHRQLDALARVQHALADKEALATELLLSREALERSHHELEQRVAQRTAELSEAVLHLRIEVEGRQRSEQDLAAKNRTLELIAQDAELPTVLRSVLETIEQRDPELITSLFLIDPDGRHLRLAATLRLPKEYCDAVDGAEIGPAHGSCGTAAHLRKRVIASDTFTDPLWANYRVIVERHGLRACWSTPIISPRGELLGTFGIYHRTPAAPTEDQIKLVDLAVHIAAVAISHDRAERDMNRLEQQLRRAQKMEAIGTLAGGIAHGFNNLLVPILGYAELLHQEFAHHPAAREQLREIINASREAKSLVHQMLAFSRERSAQQQPLVLGPIIDNVVALLRVSIPANVRLVAPPHEQEPTVLADASQLHHLLMNLCQNALDAMGQKGGVLTIDRREVSDHDPHPQPASQPPGRHLCLEISDTGEGIAPEVIDRIFDPFFTTRAVGQGTGLGLAVVHGIVTSHQGSIAVESQVGRGTVFRVYLPVHASTEPLAPAPHHSLHPFETAPAPAPCIAVVDDENVVARLTGAVLQRHGYRAEVFTSAAKALAWLEADPARADLLLTDLTMPEMNGVELAIAVSKLRPTLPILILTGFGKLSPGQLQSLPNPWRVLGKPFEREQLLATVTALLSKPD